MNDVNMKKNIKQVIKILLYIGIVVGIGLRVIMVFYDRSLWIDEAMLASPILSHSYSQIWLGNLEYGQSAPIGWLFVVKFFTLMLGQNEWVLRLWSLITGIGAIGIFYLIQKKILKLQHPELFTAFFALLRYYIQYSNECKPYMSDNFFILIVLFLWGTYCKEKISLSKLAITYSIILWFSFPAVFLIAAVMILECIRQVYRIMKLKTGMNAFFNILKCSIVAVSFLINYILWIAPSSKNLDSSAHAYWDWLKFPIIPRSLNDVKLIFQMFKQIITPLEIKLFVLYAVLLVFAIIKLVKNRKEKDSLIFFPIIISSIIILIASSMGYYPIQDRLVQFLGIFILLFCAWGFDELYNSKISFKLNKIYINIPVVMISLSFVIVALLSVRQILPKHTYRLNSEVWGNMEYLHSNLKDDDMIYVFNYSIPVFSYETNYKYGDMDIYSDNDKLPYIYKHIIYGNVFMEFDNHKAYEYDYVVDENKLIQLVNTITNYKSVYLFTSHVGNAQSKCISPLINELKKYGSIEVVNCNYETYLYHFENKN